MINRTRAIRSSVFAALLAAGLLVRPARTFGDDEYCASCGPPVTLAGEFTHNKDAPQGPGGGAIGGAGNDAVLYREDVNGKTFTVSIATLPPGKYTITVGM